MEKKKTILIIDKDPTYLKLWEKIFKSIPGCHYFITNDTSAAEQIIKAGKLDMLISGFVLDKSNGYEMAELAGKYNKDAEIVITTSYDCNINRFDLKKPKFSILYKPYKNIEDIERFVKRLLHNEDVFSDVSEDSFSENEIYPEVFEWRL